MVINMFCVCRYNNRFNPESISFYFHLNMIFFIRDSYWASLYHPGKLLLPSDLKCYQMWPFGKFTHPCKSPLCSHLIFCCWRMHITNGSTLFWPSLNVLFTNSCREYLKPQVVRDLGQTARSQRAN